MACNSTTCQVLPDTPESPSAGWTLRAMQQQTAMKPKVSSFQLRGTILCQLRVSAIHLHPTSLQHPQITACCA
eukprot:1965747-Pleurochrysis_carterae.AAC.2